MASAAGSTSETQKPVAEMRPVSVPSTVPAVPPTVAVTPTTNPPALATTPTDEEQGPG